MTFSTCQRWKFDYRHIHLILKFHDSHFPSITYTGVLFAVTHRSDKWGSFWELRVSTFWQIIYLMLYPPGQAPIKISYTSKHSTLQFKHSADWLLFLFDFFSSNAMLKFWGRAKWGWNFFYAMRSWRADPSKNFPRKTSMKVLETAWIVLWRFFADWTIFQGMWWDSNLALQSICFSSASVW